MSNEILKTKNKVETEKRDLDVYNEFNELMSVQGAQIGPVTAILMEKYSIGSSVTIRNIRQRVALRLAGK
ncbi:MAG: hypothetical protein SNH27_07405 [Rikenellaceae bacterium]